MNEIQNHIKIILKDIDTIIYAIAAAGGQPFLVGGSVRDLVLGMSVKDLDIEVHKLSIGGLEEILKDFGPVMFVGKKFGVLKIQGINADWSLPRKDSIGRKPGVAIDPYMGIEQACRRRDITMNAMAIDLSPDSDDGKFHIIDPYGGLNDLHNKQLRAVDEKLFLDDPLRFFRVMQFIGRFEMEPDQVLNKLCKEMSLSDADTSIPLARERIYEEVKKLLLKAHRPSLGFRWLHHIGRLQEIFPELYALIGVQQLPTHHPEGDVFEHTMQAIDAAAQLSYYQTDDEKIIIMFGVLCHDLGKAITTDRELHAYGHENAGVPLAQQLLKRLTDEQFLIKAVSTLVHYHLLPFRFVAEHATAKAYKRLANTISPACNLRQLGLVALADRQGRNGTSTTPLINEYHDLYEQFLHHTDAAAVTCQPEAPVLLGRHLLDVVPAGPQLGKLLHEAYTIQIEENINDVDTLRKRVIGK